MSQNKKAYFQGGGGVNEPTPGKPKYKVDPSITVQPRFVEPFYRNYDLYDTEGVNGPANHGPGSGYHELMKHKSVKEFLEFRRQRLKNKYVADDSWIDASPSNYKERINKMKVRASLFYRFIKVAQEQHYITKCKNCNSVVEQCRCMGPKIEKFVDYCGNCKKSTDENDGANFDYGQGLYANMDKYKSVADFEHKAPKGPSVIMDVNHIDFPIDDQISSGSIIGTSESFESPRALGPAIDSDGSGSTVPTTVGFGDIESYPTSTQIGGYTDKYLPLNDFEGKSPDQLDFGRDYTDDEVPTDCTDEKLQQIMTKYLTPEESGIFGLPDGIEPESDLDAENTISTENPDYGITDSGRQMYEDKWNI